MSSASRAIDLCHHPAAAEDPKRARIVQAGVESGVATEYPVLGTLYSVLGTSGSALSTRHSALFFPQAAELLLPASHKMTTSTSAYFRICNYGSLRDPMRFSKYFVLTVAVLWCSGIAAAQLRQIAIIDVPGRPRFDATAMLNGYLVMAHAGANTVKIFDPS